MKILSVLPLISIYSICTAAYVDKLNIIGNEHTKMHIIKRELHHPIPGEYDSTLALEDRNRIYNLGLFSKVEIEPIDSFYTISLVETFQFVPVPMVEHSETKGWRFGGAIAILNFRGINQQLSFGANTIIGEEFNYGLVFSDPWITGDHVSLSSWAYQASGIDPFYSYNYMVRELGIRTGFYNKKYHKFNIAMIIDYSAIDTNGINVAILEKYENMPLHYKYISVPLTYHYDTRDIYIDPTSGALTTLSLTPSLSFGQSENIYSFWFQYKKYFKISDGYLNPVLSFDTRFLFKKSKSFPIGNYIHLGGKDFVRGYSPIPEKNSLEVTHLIEGYNVAYHSVQLQHTLFEKEEFDFMKFGLDFGLELGIDMVYFVDMGIISDELISFKLNNTIVGYGFGFRFFASGIGVMGLDFGFNPYGQQFTHY